MEDEKIAAMLLYCEQKAAAGIELSLVCNSEGAFGESRLLLDGHENIELQQVELDLMNYLSEYLTYSAAALSKTSSRLKYESSGKRFVGFDYYTAWTNEELECSIALAIPADIWFEKVLVSIQGSTVFDVSTVITPLVSNGPASDFPSKTKCRIEVGITAAVQEYLYTVGHTAYIQNYLLLDRKQFTSSGINCCYTISKLYYGFEGARRTPVTVLMDR